MNDSYPLPFDTLRPFKSKPEEFTPRDTLPWERLAANLLRDDPQEKGFAAFRAVAVIERDVTLLVEHLALPPGAAILDLGCGPGFYSHRLAQHGYQVTGIDIADSFLNYARKRAKAEDLPCEYRHLSMFELSFEAEFEAILLINSVATLLTLAEIESLLIRIKRALKPGGHLIAEFAIAPPNFSSSEATVSESIFLFNDSPWSTNFHAYMVRNLTLPSTSERVTHHLIAEPNGRPQEYWSRFILHSESALTEALIEHGLQVKGFFREKMGQPYQANNNDRYCFIWAVKGS